MIEIGAALMQVLASPFSNIPMIGASGAVAGLLGAHLLLFPKARVTVLFPVFWRFRDEEGTTQVALNTVWIDRKSSRGANWDFYFLPVFHVGDSPNGSAWDFLFGFVGYKREGTYKQLKLLWIPIDLTKPPPTSTGAPAK